VTQPKAPRPRAVGLLLLLGSLAAAFAATASAWANVGLCGNDPGGECFVLVRTLSLRVGLVAGAATALMLLVVMGLHRMTLQNDLRRATQGRPDFGE
jgi:hypothetical protein